MPTTIRVANVGPGLSVQGGISRLIELIQEHLPPGIDFRHVPTFTKFTGDQGAAASERGSRLSQFAVFLIAFLHISFLALGRRTIFHIHFAGRGSLLRKGFICILLRILRCKYVVHSHAADVNLFQPWLPAWCRHIVLWGLAGAAKVIVLTRFWQDYYASFLHLPEDRLLLLYNPSNPPTYVPTRLPRTGCRLLFLGRIGVRKGAFDIIRALASLPEEIRSQCSLTMAGDGDTAEARRLASELNCLDRVSVPGWLDKASVAFLLEDADVLLLPSHAEGMAMALLEGMGWGLSLITTTAGGSGEFLKDGTNCIMVAPGNIREIANAISDLALRPERRRQLGSAARETANKLSIGRYVQSLSTLYSELAGCNRYPAAEIISSVTKQL